MESRVQTINDDTVLEVSTQEIVKKRHSEKNLLERKAYFEGMIAKCQAGLDEVNLLLENINYEKETARGK